MDVKRILSNSLWFGVIPKISTLINIILLPVITPYLTKYDYGIWGIVTSYSGIGLALYSLGLNVHLTNSYYEYPSFYNKIWSKMLFLLMASATLTACLLSVILFNSFSEVPILNRVIVCVLSTFPVLFNSNLLLAQHLYTLRSTPKPLVIRTLSGSLLGIFLSFILIYYFRLGYIGFIAGAAFNALFTFLLFVRPIWIKENIYPIREKVKGKLYYYLKISLPVIPHTLGFMLLTSSSRIIMDWYEVPLSDIGIYTSGYTLGDYISIISLSVATAISPLIQKKYRAKDYIGYRHLYYFSQGITILAVVFFSVWIEEIYTFFMRNADLYEGVFIARYSCFANIVFPLYVFMSTITFIEKKTKQLLWLVFIPGFLNCILCIVFIPIFGYKIVVFLGILSYWSQMFIPFFVKFYRGTTHLWLGSLNKLILLSSLLFVLVIVSHSISAFNVIFKLVFSVILLLGLGFFLFRFKKMQI